MTKTSGRLLLWSPRILGILICLFLSIFALDAFGEGKTLLQGLRDFAIHVSPMAALLIVVFVSWRWEWVGGTAFVALGLAHVWWAGLVRHRPEWIPPIAGPLLVVGGLFWLSWRRRRMQHGLR